MCVHDCIIKYIYYLLHYYNFYYPVYQSELALKDFYGRMSAHGVIV